MGELKLISGWVISVWAGAGSIGGSGEWGRLSILGFERTSPGSSSAIRRKKREEQRWPRVNLSSQ